MQRIFIAAIVIVMMIMILYITTLDAAQQLRVARVSMLRGTVKSNDTALRLFDAVTEGDVLKVSSGASIRLIFYRDYHEEELAGECAVSVNNKGVTLTSGDKSKKKITRQAYKSSLDENFAPRCKEIAGGASKYMAIKPAQYTLYPIANTIEMTGRLTFTWQKEPKVPYYKVTLSRLEEEKPVPIHSAIVTEASFTIPDSIKPLENDRVYFFSVEGFLKNPDEMGSEFPESRIAASSPPYVFSIPTREDVDFIAARETELKRLKKGSDDWTSCALFLFSLYLEYGADDRAARLGRELQSCGKDSDLFADNAYLKALMENYAK